MITENGMLRKAPPLQKPQGWVTQRQRPSFLETDSAQPFDLPMAILLEYLLERFFEAGEGAKAV
jgi:hypothetical protein